MLAISRRYEFWKTPDDLQYTADRMSGRATWQLYAHDADNTLTSCPVMLSSWSLSACVLASLTVSTIHLLIWLSWCPLWFDSNGWRAIDSSSGFFPYPVDKARAVWLDIASSLVPLDWDVRYLGRWSILEPGMEVGSWPGIQLPVTRTPTFDTGYFLFRCEW